MGRFMNLNVKIAILNTGKTQAEIARELKIHQSRLSNIVNGWIKPKENERRTLSNYLGISEHELLSDLKSDK